MAAFIPGLGLVEALIILFMMLFTVALPIAVVVFAVRASRSELAQADMASVVPVAGGAESLRCAVCDSQYSMDYDGCPYCARSTPPQSSLDVTKWGSGRVWALAAGTAWPFAYAFVAGLFMTTVVATAPPSSAAAPLPALFFVLIAVHILTILLMMAMTVIYIIIAIKSPISSNAKVLWAVAMVLSNFIAIPVAFYFLVWGPRRKARLARGLGKPDTIIRTNAGERVAENTDRGDSSVLPTNPGHAPVPAPIPAPPQRKPLGRRTILFVAAGAVALLSLCSCAGYFAWSGGGALLDGMQYIDEPFWECDEVRREVYETVQIGQRRDALRGMSPEEMFAYIRDEIGYEADDALLDDCPSGGTLSIWISEGSELNDGTMVYTVEVYCSVHAIPRPIIE